MILQPAIRLYISKYPPSPSSPSSPAIADPAARDLTNPLTCILCSPSPCHHLNSCTPPPCSSRPSDTGTLTISYLPPLTCTTGPAAEEAEGEADGKCQSGRKISVGWSCGVGDGAVRERVNVHLERVKLEDVRVPWVRRGQGRRWAERARWVEREEIWLLLLLVWVCLSVAVVV